ncbi:hypothetical protein IJ768_03580 [Candidatus Saccharibacteria bacterium]|nr:hypothetical protein [Candidatus Saccharibacteria bacterium]
MLAQGLISWWYVDGYKLFVNKLWTKLGDTIDLFSIGSLIKTLFAPYRQIAANETGTSIDDKLLAFVDRLVSRLVGSVARIGIILAGIVVILIQFLGSILSLVIWPLIPFSPILFIVLAVMGVTL